MIILPKLKHREEQKKIGQYRNIHKYAETN